MSCSQVVARYSGGNVVRNVHVDIVAENLYPVEEKKDCVSYLHRKEQSTHTSASGSITSSDNRNGRSRSAGPGQHSIPPRA